MIETGIPQVSVLSLELFIWYINNFFKDEKSHFNIFDDILVLTESKALNCLNADLNKPLRGIENWSSKWRVVVNRSKTKLMLLNCSPYIDVSFVRGDRWAIKLQTKLLCVIKDDKLEHKELRPSVILKATGT